MPVINPRRFLQWGVALAAFILPSMTVAQTLSPYSVFSAMTLSDMDSLRVKLTYGGPQDTPIRTIGLVVAGTTVPTNWFEPFYQQGFSYSNDRVGASAYAATRNHLKSLIDNVATSATLTDGSVDTDGYISFALLSTAGDGQVKVYERILAAANGRLLFSKIFEALAANEQATAVLRRFACQSGSMPTGMPADVSANTLVSFNGLRRDHASSGGFVGTVTVKNVSTGTLAAPLYLVVRRERGNATLQGSSGQTCNILPAGSPFIRLEVGSGLLDGRSTSVSIRFRSSTLDKSDVTFRVYSGIGAP